VRIMNAEKSRAAPKAGSPARTVDDKHAGVGAFRSKPRRLGYRNVAVEKVRLFSAHTPSSAGLLPAAKGDAGPVRRCAAPCRTVPD
jgi:hypothetical protein